MTQHHGTQNKIELGQANQNNRLKVKSKKQEQTEQLQNAKIKEAKTTQILKTTKTAPYYQAQTKGRHTKPKQASTAKTSKDISHVENLESTTQ